MVVYTNEELATGLFDAELDAIERSVYSDRWLMQFNALRIIGALRHARAEIERLKALIPPNS